MPVREEGDMITEWIGGCSCDQEDTNKPRWSWSETLALGFHRCVDTNAIIWPLTKAYTKLHTRPSPDDGKTEWLSAKAYTFRTLTNRI